MRQHLIKGAKVVNENTIEEKDVLIRGGYIDKIGTSINPESNYEEINAEGQHLLPGLIDDQVHFRQPGLTHKANIYKESKAAVSGGVTSFMEMPNTKPPTFTQDLLQAKYNLAQVTSLANFSFFMGVSNDNREEWIKTNPKEVCGLKIFMGSSTGNLLVDSELVLEEIFRDAPTLIATHCEQESRVKGRSTAFREKYGENIEIFRHAEIRDVDACYNSSFKAVELAKKHNTRLHILHISTEKELSLFDNSKPLEDKLITAEACVHHLYFDGEDYEKYGTKIKCNPAIKFGQRKALIEGVNNNLLDVICTDHAPHTIDEKNNNLWNAPSGVPLVQHSLYILLDLYKKGELSLEKIVEKTSHSVAKCFRVKQRGFIREGYFADLVLVDLNKHFTVRKDNINYKCKWSPFEGYTFNSLITNTFVNGNRVFVNGQFDECMNGQRLSFDR